MQLTTLEELEWIHDCELLHLTYNAPGSGPRSIELTFDCHPDLGYAPWEGKRLVLVAVDVFASEHFVFAIANSESIDAIRPGVSLQLRERLATAIQMGVYFPDLAVTVSFSSGSSLQLICRHLMVGVAPPESLSGVHSQPRDRADVLGDG